MALIFPEYLTGNNHGRAKRYKNMTANEMYQLRNFAFAVDAFALVVFLTTLALSWYSGDDGDDEYKKGMKSLVYSSLLASISERFTQLGGAPFLLSTSDIIKAVSVGTVLMDDAHFLIDAAQDLLNLLYSKFSNDTISDDIDMENWNTKLLNGSFQGKTKAQRNITRAAAMLLPALGVDALPYLFVLDEIAPQHNEEGGLDSWTDYDLNYFKSKTEKGNLAAAKFYGTIVPTGTLSKVINSTFPEYPLTIQKKKNSSEKEIKAPTKSKYNNNYSQNYSQKYSRKY
jgi:hypothetical protein